MWKPAFFFYCVISVQASGKCKFGSRADKCAKKEAGSTLLFIGSECRERTKRRYSRRGREREPAALLYLSTRVGAERNVGSNHEGRGGSKRMRRERKKEREGGRY